AAIGIDYPVVDHVPLAAAVQSMQGKLSEAEQRARSAVLVAHASPKVEIEARFALIDVLFAQTHYEAAKGELEIVESVLKAGGTSMERESARADWMRAQMHLEDNRFDLARPLYERAIEAALRAEGPQSRLAIDIRRDFAFGLWFVREFDASKRQ